MPTSKVIGN